jgi:hypothetical protein
MNSTGIIIKTLQFRMYVILFTKNKFEEGYFYFLILKTSPSFNA